MAFSDLQYTANDVSLTGGVFTGFFALIAAFIILFLVIAIAVYVYTSFAYMRIAQKAKRGVFPGYAFIPIVGPALISSSIAKMPWWPILLLIGFFIPFINIICFIAFVIFSVIWNWKMFEAVKRPGWWAIFIIIPFLNIVFLIFLGIAAWGRR